MTSKSSVRANPDSRRLFLSGPASMIWTTTSSSSYGTTLGLHGPAVTPNHPQHLHNNNGLGNASACMTMSASYNNNNNNRHPVLSNHHHVNSSGGSSSSSSSFNNSSTSTLAPLITSGDNTRINNYAFNHHFKTTGRPLSQSQAPQVNNSSSFTPCAFQVARDRKPLTPEYEVPSFGNSHHNHSSHQQQPQHQNLFYPQSDAYLHQSLDRLDREFLSSLPLSGMTGSPTSTSLDEDPMHQTSLSDDKSSHIYSHIYDPSSVSVCDRHSIPIRHPGDKLTYFTTHRGLPDHYDPIREVMEKRRRRKCLLLGFLFAVAVFLAVTLISSFIMFVVSSYQSNEVLKTEELKQQSATLNPADVLKDLRPSDTELTEVDVLNHTEAYLVTTERSQPPPPPPSLVADDSMRGNSASTSNNNNNNIMINTNGNSNSILLYNSTNIVKLDDDLNCLEGDEWKCRDGLCIPSIKRCDGHFNCYDHSDEYDCDCPVNEGFFRCGSETSCLEPSKRCDSIIDCWDGSDEHLCIK